MTRDLDLLRDLLIRIGASPTGWDAQPCIACASNPAGVAHHLQLLRAARLIADAPRRGTVVLTPSGRDFLNAVRSDAVWRKVKHQTFDGARAFPLKLIPLLASVYMQKLSEQPA